MLVKWVDKFDGKGNSFGYSSHQKNLMYAMKKNGMNIDDNAKIALHIKPLCHYEKIPGKINVVYTMYEYTTIPDNWIKKLKDIDVLVVPCKHNKELFRKYTDIPIYICLEGCDTNKYKYIEREFPKKKPFRFYWFGVNNPRKGYLHVLKAWNDWTILFPQFKETTELYIKACNGKDEGIQKGDNVIFDNRTLSIDELVKLNHEAHAFIFPSMGEGFGLTLVEALSTGLPAAYTNYSGMCDYMREDWGYPIEYTLSNITTLERLEEWTKAKRHETQAAYPIIESVLEQMIRIYINYKSALVKGKIAAEIVRKHLTWDISAKRLLQILEDVYGDKNRS